jgi:hypothetical protein
VYDSRLKIQWFVIFKMGWKQRLLFLMHDESLQTPKTQECSYIMLLSLPNVTIILKNHDNFILTGSYLTFHQKGCCYDNYILVVGDNPSILRYTSFFNVASSGNHLWVKQKILEWMIKGDFVDMKIVSLSLSLSLTSCMKRAIFRLMERGDLLSCIVVITVSNNDTTNRRSSTGSTTVACNCRSSTSLCVVAGMRWWIDNIANKSQSLSPLFSFRFIPFPSNNDESYHSLDPT